MNKDINVFCNCGCGDGFSIKFRFEYDDDDLVFISTLTSGFYAQQCGFVNRIKRCIKAAWFMLRGKEFYLHEIALTKEQWKEFVKTVSDVKLQQSR